MADALPEAELAAQLGAISAADDAVARTRAAARACQTELAAAEKSRAALEADERKAWADLGTARDKLVPLGAPGGRRGTGTGPGGRVGHGRRVGRGRGEPRAPPACPN